MCDKRGAAAWFPRRKLNIEVWLGQQPLSLFRPFDQAYGPAGKHFSEARVSPLIRVTEPIKIKVVQV